MSNTESSVSKSLRTMNKKESKTSFVSELNPAIDISNLREEFKGILNYNRSSRNNRVVENATNANSKQLIAKARRSTMFSPLNVSQLGITKKPRRSKAHINTIFSRSHASRRSSKRSYVSDSLPTLNRRGSIATVTNNVTLPKNLFKEKGITKDNKSRWEAASRKLRAIVPVFIQLNNQRVVKEHK